MTNKILITTGDVNGIGAEITIKAVQALSESGELGQNFALVSNRKILDFYGGADLDCEIIEIPYDAPIETGKITAASGEFSYQSLKKACELRPKAIVTAPVAKEAMHLAGHYFNGQTEVLEHFLSHDGQKAEMLFVAGDFRVLLLTRHCALKDVKITQDLIFDKVERLVSALQIPSPRLALCALNPHAGENGVIGTEEHDIIIPAVDKLRAKGIDITLPQPSDTLFLTALDALKANQKMPYDCYIAMYHDQGLIPMKLLAGERAVNVTIGLDILRTSPSHGTAFDIAGKNLANPNSMIEAIRLVLTPA